jgi:catechol 2,3-dioxygenase-like lactoylglutathione lyase family enzyme
MSATMTATAVKFHVGLHVSDLERSVQFYRVLLGVPPAKHLPDYAKFELADPPLVLALIPSPQSPGGTLNHLGLRVPDAATLVDVQRRLEEVGIATQRQEGVECCYARQTKFWVADPDRNLWEVYVFEEDLAHSGFDDPPLSPDVTHASAVVWEHRLTEPLPARIPFDEQTVDEVRLEGTFNADLPTEQMKAFLAEVKRVLRCGGRVAVHGLTGDRPFPGKPALPGLAAMVQRVPVDVEVMGALGSVGFQLNSAEFVHYH